MRENGMIEDEALFIDGTKLEADANLYSFTWKRAIEKYEAALNGKISQLYDQLIQEGVNLALSKEEGETRHNPQKNLHQREGKNGRRLLVVLKTIKTGKNRIR